MHSNKVITIIERVKWHSRNLNAQEQEMLRDELLSLLLFKNPTADTFSNHKMEQSLTGLTEEEKALILKLASQAEQLYRLNRNKDND